MVKNGTLASPAMARASSVLPVPGEPTMSTPVGILPPSFWVLAGIFPEVDDFDHFLLRLFDARHVREGNIDLILAQEPRTALAE